MLQRDYDPGVRAAAARALGTTHNPGAHPRRCAGPPTTIHGPGVREAATVAADALAPFSVSPRWAAAYSTLCPGCGYFYLHQPGRAAAYLGGAAAMVLLGLHVEDDNPTAPNGVRLQDHDDPLDPLTVLAVQNLWFYGIFATYRDARLARADLGYRYPGRQGAADRSAGRAVQPARAQEPVGVGGRAGAARRRRRASRATVADRVRLAARVHSPTGKA